MLDRSFSSAGNSHLDGLPKVWIIVLNWNRPEDTVACVRSLKTLDYLAYQLLIVDNGSTDNSIDVFQNLDGIELLVIGENLGFAGGMNRGIKYALARGADFTLLLNNDVFVAKDMLDHLMVAMASDSSLGMVSPLIFYADEPERVWFSGMTFTDRIYVIRRGLHLQKPLSPIALVDFISGCAMLVRREVWERVGFFDERFFMYYEDLDLALRVRRSGYRLACVTDAKMWHALSASTGGKDSPIKQYYQVRSMLIFAKKHTHGPVRWLNVGLRLAHAVYIALSQFLQGRLDPKAVRLYLRGIREVLGRA
jgi:GT2 family glycosyltransferase